MCTVEKTTFARNEVRIEFVWEVICHICHDARGQIAAFLYRNLRVCGEEKKPARRALAFSMFSWSWRSACGAKPGKITVCIKRKYFFPQNLPKNPPQNPPCYGLLSMLSLLFTALLFSNPAHDHHDIARSLHQCCDRVAS